VIRERIKGVHCCSAECVSASGMSRNECVVVDGC